VAAYIIRSLLVYVCCTVRNQLVAALFGTSWFRTVQQTYTSKVKGKAIPLQAWTGPEGSRRVRFPDFKTIRT